MQGLLADPRVPPPVAGGTPLGAEGLQQLDLMRQKLIRRYLEEGRPVPPELRQGMPPQQPQPRGLLQPAMGDVLQGPWGLIDRLGRPHPTESSGGGGLLIRPKQFEPKKPPAEKPNINIQKQEKGETWGPRTRGWNMLPPAAKAQLWGKPVKGSEYEGLVTSRTPSARDTGLNYDKMTPKEWKALLKSGESKEGLKPFTVEQWNAATRGEPQQFSGRNPPSARDTAQTSMPDSLSPFMKPGMPGYNPATDSPNTLAGRRALTNSLLGEAPQRSPIGPGSSTYESGIQGLRNITAKQKGQELRNTFSAWGRNQGYDAAKTSKAAQEISDALTAAGRTPTEKLIKFFLAKSRDFLK